MNKVEKLLKQLKEAKEYPKDNDIFHDIVKSSLTYLDISDDEVATKFDMSRPSITRWRKGLSAPHPSLRKHVYSWLEKKLLDTKEPQTYTNAPQDCCGKCGHNVDDCMCG